MTVRNKYVVFALLFVTSLITNAQARNSISNDSVPPAIDGDSIRNPSASSNSDYSKAYEIVYILDLLGCGDSDEAVMLL